MRRDRALYVRVNEYERDRVVQAAADHRLPVADFVRIILREATNTLPLCPAEPASLPRPAGPS